MKMPVHALASIAVALLAASAVNAATFTSTPGSPDTGPAAGQNVVVSFDAPNAAGYAFTAGNVTTATGTTGNAAAPAGDMTMYGYVSSTLSPNYATLSTPNVRTISFYWGSVDGFNSVDVLGAGGSLLTTISGGNLPLDNGNQSLGLTNRRVFITAGPGENITGLTFRSTGVAFEFDTIAASGAVPEPQTWALLIAGFGMVGLAARRRRTVAVSA